MFKKLGERIEKLSKKTLIIIIAVLLIIEIVLCIFYARIRSNNSSSSNSNTRFSRGNFSSEDITEDLEDSSISYETTSSTVISTTAEVTSALTENIELHTTYYLEECYVEEDEEVSSGANLLKYTNEEYLVAPYDCIIKTLNIPDEGGQCNNNYIQISSTSLLAISLSVDESIVEDISLGQEAEITISAYEDKVLTGYVTSISNTANNGKFTLVVEFDNDGDVKLGMTAEVTI